VDHVDIDVIHSEILGLIGPNGAGKTSLVNAITGYVPVSGGQVQVGSRSLVGLSPASIARAGVSRTFQAARVFRNLTVFENIEVGALVREKRRSRARVLAEQVLESSGLTSKRDVLAGGLAFGDERRVSVARALAQQPDVLLLDEPAAGLNETETDQLEAFLRKVSETHQCGIVLIEHDMRLLMKLSHRIQVLAQGRTLAIGSPSEIRSNQEVIDVYLGGAHASDL
jgi:branched-chain amino acid transport system ATP-binding protein